MTRGIYECANQLAGHVGPDTPDDLAAFLLREAAEAEKLAAEIESLRALLQRAKRALQPFADCVFNDNGDCTVEPSSRLTSADVLLDAHHAYRAIRALDTKEQS